MSEFAPADTGFAERTRASFAKQGMMTTAQAAITAMEPGSVTITFPYSAQFTQQHGYLHAGFVTAMVDSACGYAAYTLMPAGAEVLTVEYKVNLMSPAQGEGFEAIGRVVRAGKTITVCEGDVFAVREGGRKHIARMLATLMRI